jgi:hypothetical protein|tara:strand:- start:590 stop:820 length:231 start_codon:yes stop_codon:yes gene_type:complete
MFATLDNLEKELKQEVKKLEDKWDKEPKHDYHFHEICGINMAIDVVERFKSKELLELDKWANDYINNREQGDTLSD